jgi:hypothetical protein
MFRNQRSQRAAVAVVVLTLLAAMPAAAGDSREPRASERSWWTQTVTWLSTLWIGHKTSSTKTSSYIDPLGQPSTALALAGSDYSSSIDPNGEH